MRRWLRCIVLGLILGLIASHGINKYQNDQDAVNQRISQLQRQQELLIIGEDNPLPILIKKVATSVVYVETPSQWRGSGIIVGPHTVLTARHVVQGAYELKIETAGGKIYTAINWIVDEDNDCALLFFDPRERFDNIAEFADSDLLQVGEVVFTMGSPYGKQLFNTVTLGIVSGLNRDIPYFGTCGLVTSDAAANPGNSGGPVFDMQGHIVGILVGSKWGAEGLGIIIPSNICKDLLENRDSPVDIYEELNFSYSSKKKDSMKHILDRMEKACGKCHK